MANQGLFTPPLLSLVIAASISAQAPPPGSPSWAGWAQCQITIQAPGYSHRETHLWTMTGAGTTNANMEIYPTSWTVTGDGSLQRVNGPTTVSAQWTVNGTLQNVTIGTTRHLDRVTVQRWTNHGPARSALTGTEISTTNGVARPRPVVLDVQQWAFPAIETATTSTRATGSNAIPFDGLRGPMNPPGGATGTAACTWDFARGGVSPSAPPPSPVSAPATPSSGTPVSGGAPSRSPTAGGSGATGGATSSAPGATAAAPALVNLSPNSIEQGTGLSGVMTLTGQGTNWRQGTTSVDFGPGMVVQGVPRVESPTSLTAQITAGYTVAPGPRAVTVTSGSEVVMLPNALTVVARTQPVITQINPNTVAAGQTGVAVTFIGSGTRWAPGQTDVNLPPGIRYAAGANALVVNSPTRLTVRVDIDPAAAPGPRDVTVMNPGPVAGSDVLTVSGGFTVTPPRVTIAQVTPSSALPGTRALTVSITGSGTHFERTSWVDFGELVGATSFTVTSPTTATAVINIDPAAPAGPRTVSVMTPSATAASLVAETATLTNGFTVGTPGTSSRYRVSAARVRFHREEPDFRPRLHGRNNEIFVTKHAQVVDRRNGAKLENDYFTWLSPTHGDINSTTGYADPRVKAGSFSPGGGIQTGDDIEIWTAGGDRAYAYGYQWRVIEPHEYVPFVLWSGELHDGVEAVLVRPVVWINAGTGNTEFGGPYHRRLEAERSVDFLAFPAIRDALNQPGIRVPIVPELVTSTRWLGDASRPIGLEVTGNYNGAPATWTDRVVVLTREKIEALLAGSASRLLEVPIRGRMTAANAIPLGDISLFLKIERLPD